MDSLRVLSDTLRRLSRPHRQRQRNRRPPEARRPHDLMWCSFDADPLILRLYGRGRAVRRQDAEWGELAPPTSPPCPANARSSCSTSNRCRPRAATPCRCTPFGRARHAGALGREKGRGRPAGLLAREEPGQHRRPAHRFAGGCTMKRILIPLVAILAACDPTPPPQPETERQPNPVSKRRSRRWKKRAPWKAVAGGGRGAAQATGRGGAAVGFLAAAMLKWLLTAKILLPRNCWCWGLLTPWLNRLGLGRLPGDLRVKRARGTFYFPFTSVILMSAARCSPGLGR
jgi:hypothetical protein